VSSAATDRRKHPRLALRLPVALTRAGEIRAVETVTEDLSAGGFSFVVRERFEPGERLECTLLMDGAAGRERVRWQCRSVVVWVQAAISGPEYRTGCRIDDYTFRIART
jgi:hypothetical protein